MRFRRSGAFGAQANAAFNDFTTRVDGRSAEVAGQASRAIVVAVRLLRIPTAIIGALPVPFVLATLAMGLLADGGVGVVVTVVALVMGAINGFFWWRRQRMLRAVDDPDRLATELGILISLTGKVDETRGALAQIAGGDGWRILARLKGVWKGTQMTGRWIDGAGDLPRARYFAPPTIGTTITLAIASLWLVPVSIVVALFSLVGVVAGSI